MLVLLKDPPPSLNTVWVRYRACSALQPLPRLYTVCDHSVLYLFVSPLYAPFCVMPVRSKRTCSAPLLSTVVWNCPVLFLFLFINAVLKLSMVTNTTATTTTTKQYF